MIDPITEQILFEQAGLSALKTIGKQIEQALKKGDAKSIKRLTDKLPKININQIKMRASKSFPKFRQKYDEIKRIIKNSKILDPSIHEPASVAIAVVAASTDMKVSDVLKRGEQGLVQANIASLLIPGAGLAGPVIKLIFFIIILIPIFAVAGISFTSAVSAVWKMGGYLLGLINNALQGVWHLMTYDPTIPGPPPTIWTFLGKGLGIDSSNIPHTSAAENAFDGGLIFKVKK
jgi:hypothetical protein